MIHMFYKDVYKIERASEETPKNGNTMLDLKISFPKSDEPVYITMFRPDNQEYWQIRAFLKSLHHWSISTK